MKKMKEKSVFELTQIGFVSVDSKGYLEDHINGAHVKKPLYKCDQCEMTFTRKASFRYHFKRAHVQKKRILEPRGTFLRDCEFCGNYRIFTNIQT